MYRKEKKRTLDQKVPYDESKGLEQVKVLGLTPPSLTCSFYHIRRQKK